MRSSLAICHLASALLALSLAPLSSSHYSHPEAGTHQAELENSPSHAQFERFHERNDLRDLNEFDEPENHTRLEKRGAMRVSYRTNSENDDLNHAFQDLLTFVGFVYNNWARVDPNIFETYFHPFHVTKVRQVAYTILRMAQPGGITDMPGNLQAFRPTDLSEIVLIRERGVPPTLAQSFNVAPRALDPKVAIYDFGWQVLRNRRFLSDYPADCSKIGSKVDYRMQFMGGLLFHEVLHFYNVGQLAWGTVLQAGEVIDDQAGTFCRSNKAYGPYEARSLREGDYGKALINNENYVWFFLHAYWSLKCPNSMPRSTSTLTTTGRAFILPESNDIPRVCYESFTGVWATIWCWFS